MIFAKLGDQTYLVEFIKVDNHVLVKVDVLTIGAVHQTSDGLWSVEVRKIIAHRNIQAEVGGFATYQAAGLYAVDCYLAYYGQDKTSSPAQLQSVFDFVGDVFPPEHQEEIC